jgi:ribosome maturation factor RimP
MDKEKIFTLITDMLEKEGLKVFEITYHKNDQTLCVLLDEKMDMDQIEKVSSRVSDLLDQYEDDLPDNYFLDVSTVGAERPIRNEEELKAALNEYIYVKTKDSEYYGTLTSYNNGVMNLKVQDKTREKDVSVEYAKAKKVRYAVKF